MDGSLFSFADQVISLVKELKQMLGCGVENGWVELDVKKTLVTGAEQVWGAVVDPDLFGGCLQMHDYDLKGFPNLSRIVVTCHEARHIHIWLPHQMRDRSPPCTFSVANMFSELGVNIDRVKQLVLEAMASVGTTDMDDPQKLTLADTIEDISEDDEEDSAFADAVVLQEGDEEETDDSEEEYDMDYETDESEEDYEEDASADSV
ncbi:hypothetical protein BC832DRAFT_81933 [Gaertneriomyces semiglobifer]|nr:hypothetical protein BC832DRAFT_81933 [Gaertneriomyces semiglobifer]